MELKSCLNTHVFENHKNANANKYILNIIPFNHTMSSAVGAGASRHVSRIGKELDSIIFVDMADNKDCSMTK